MQKKPTEDKREKGTASSNFWCDICKKSSHTTDRCWKKMTCNKCKRQGHIAKYCRTRDINRANFSEEEDNSEGAVYSCQIAQDEKEDTWIVDSGCTNHMSSNQDIFRDIDSSCQAKIHMGNVL